MYHSSTQRKFWTYANEGELTTHRRDAHRRFIQQRIDQRDCLAIERAIESIQQDLFSGDLEPMSSLEEHLHPDNPQVVKEFLSLEEESELRRFYQTMLRDFCSKFKQPDLPRSTVATGFALFQRAYVNESVMRLHPKHMMITCMWIAMKVDEHHISMEQFVAHLRGDTGKAVDIIIHNEPYVMKKLRFHLMVHLPYRACEGFLIDIKVRYQNLSDPDRLRPAMAKFIETSIMSDALLLYPPSQIALAAVMHSAEEIKEDLTDYVERVLVGQPITKPFSESGDSEDRAEEAMEQDEAELGSQTSIHLLAVVDEIRHHVHEFGKLTTSKDRIKKIEAKLESCRDPAFNPDTDEYQRRIAKLLQIDLDSKFE